MTSYETPAGRSIETVEATRSLHVQRAGGYVYIDLIDAPGASDAPNDDDYIASVMLTPEQADALREAL